MLTIFYHNFLSFQDLKDAFDIRGTFLDYGGLLAAIPKDWKNAILHGNHEHTNEPTVTQLTVGNVSARYARLMFAEKCFCPPLTESYLREQTFTPSAVYELPLKITIENKLRSFQFETSELEVFIVFLEIKIQCEREIAITNGNLNKCRNKLTTLCISD